ncbi:MAG: hypothetical protein ACFE0P_07390 [Oceanicaulis sp.]
MRRILAALALSGLATPCFAQALPFEQVWKTGGLANPESVIYAPELDAFLVSNINGGVPNEEDGDGYIARLSLEGELDPEPFATGLDGPKGMAIKDGRLYVADFNDLVEIDLSSGAVLNRHHLEGAQFLNDVTVTPAGEVLVTDMRAGQIWTLGADGLDLWMEDEAFGTYINGLLAEEDRLLALTAQGLVAIDYETRAVTVFAPGVEAGDGAVPDGRGGYVATSWGGRIYHVSAEGETRTVSDTRLMGVNSADPGYAPQAGLFAVPTFFDNAVLAFRFAETD